MAKNEVEYPILKKQSPFYSLKSYTCNQWLRSTFLGEKEIIDQWFPGSAS